MDPNYPYQSYHSSSAAQTSSYYPTASAAPTTDPGPPGEAFQQQTAAQLGYEGPLRASSSSHDGPYSAPHPSQPYSYMGQQTGYSSSYGESNVGYSHVHTHHHQGETHQRGYGDDLEPYDFSTGLRSGMAPNFHNTFPQDRPGYPQQSGMPPPRHEGQHVPPPSTSQNVPSVTAVVEPVNLGTSGGPDAQGPQAPGNQTRPGYPRENVRKGWSVRSEWIFYYGSSVDGRNYTEAHFRRDYDKHWKNRVEAKEDLWQEFLNLRFAYLGY